MRLAVFGSGYVGLVSGACFADIGHQVVCVDIDQEKVARLNKGEIPIYEPGLDRMVSSCASSGRLTFTSDAGRAIEQADIVFIAVGTPPTDDGAADLSGVLSVARSIAEHMNEYKLVVNKSTSPVGTAQRIHELMASTLAERGAAIEFDVCSNPEFLKEGAAIEDFTRGPRIVVGASSSKARQLMRDCYEPYNRNHDKMVFMDPRSAELTKYAANVMLATKISLMNEFANLAEEVGADIEAVRQGIGSDPRIGYHFIYPGCGYGGSCFPKDVRALSHLAQEHAVPADILQAVDRVNTRQRERLFQRLQQLFGDELAGKTIAIWGLAFKPGTDDLREAPSRVLMESLWRAGASVRAYDPIAMTKVAQHYPGQSGLYLASSQDDALQNADALVVCTEWKQFRSVDFDAVKRALRYPFIVDGRNIYNPEKVRAAGLLYYAIGRGDSVKVSGPDRSGL